MTKIFVAVVIALASISAYGQAVRVDLPVQTLNTNIPVPHNWYPVLAIPLAQVNVCNAPANAVPCTNFATTYTAFSALATCPSNTQLTRSNSTICVNLADNSGNWGVWLLPGNYQYTITTVLGNFGPFDLTVNLPPGALPLGTINQGLYYAANGTTVTPLNYGYQVVSLVPSFGGFINSSADMINWYFGSGAPPGILNINCTTSNNGVRYVDSTSWRWYTCQGPPGIGPFVWNADEPQAQYQTASFQGGAGDGVNAITAGTYPIILGENTTGVTVTFTGFKCWSDNNGTTTIDFKNGAGTSLLTSPITCTTSGASGTQSATVTIISGDIVRTSLVADGTTKNVLFSAHVTY